MSLAAQRGVLQQLARCEDLVCELHRVYSFEALTGTPFLHFLSRHKNEIDLTVTTVEAPLVSGGRWRSPKKCPRIVQLVLLLAKQDASLFGNSVEACLDACVEQQQQAERSRLRQWRLCLESYAGMPLGDFGFRSMRDLVRTARSWCGSRHRIADTFIPSSLCLVANACGSTHTAGSTCMHDGLSSAAEAQVQIFRAPYLVDLGQWLNWTPR